jgi:uncharacterized protein (TIGR00162 family)
MTWTIEYATQKPVLKKPVLVEGMPGIGNTGKIVVDFVIDKLKAKKLFSMYSYDFPHSVFVNNKNLVELPTIEMYYKKRDEGDLLLLVGDVQPIDERSCYEFCEVVLKEVKSYGVSEIVTLGGIGLPTPPISPKVYITGNDQKLIDKYRKGTLVNNKLYGVVGPIVGVSGLLLGIGQRHKVPAVSLLAETFGHPMYIGLKGAKEILKVLKKKLNLKLDMNEMDKEITEMEEGIKRSEELAELTSKVKGTADKEVSYIG